MYDYGFTLYDPATLRRNNIDPLAENSRRWSPYSYAYNNPMTFTDPDGMQGTDWKKDAKGYITYDANLTAENAETHLQRGEEYIGANVGVNVSNDAGNYSLNYNDDGSITAGNTIMGITGDGIQVYGRGSPVAGSGNMVGDRGSGGKIDADNAGGNVGMLVDAWNQFVVAPFNWIFNFGINSPLYTQK